MEKYESSLKFEKYSVNEVHFIKNCDFQLTDSKIDLDWRIKKNTEINDNKMKITLDMIIFNNSKENNYPFEIKVSITGYFYVEGEKPKSLEKNAIAILYPYIRSLISTYTSNSNTITLTLPIINVNKLIEEQEKEN